MQKEDNEISELNGEDYYKGCQKSKTKSLLKGQCIKCKDEKEEESVSRNS